MTSNIITQQRLDLTWRMLATLGTPARAQPIKSTPVDPECALILGAICKEDDVRIGEMAVWFTAAAHRSLSLTRTKSIANSWGNPAHYALADLGNSIVHTPGLRQWSKQFATQLINDSNLKKVTNPLAIKLGTHNLSPAITAAPGAFRLRMRLAFGVGARTEALAALIVNRNANSDPAQAWMTLLELEQATGFGKRHILDSLPAMTLAGLLDHQRSGRSHQYRLHSGAIKNLGLTPVTWINWIPRIAALLTLEKAVQEVSTHGTVGMVMDALRTLNPHTPTLTTTFLPHSDTETIVERFLAWAISETTELVTVE